MKIGIMTMHRVQNLGSVLQAYALQYKIKQLGYDSELIDYEFPPLKEKRFEVKTIASKLWDALQGFPEKKRRKKIDNFRQSYLICSEKSYNRESLLKNPPIYDVYCTGSDQVWNPFHVGEDTSFMMDFAPAGVPRFSYASSFASKEIKEPLLSLYTPLISCYNSITVREQSGVDIVREMTGKEASVVCDPTLLMTSEEWTFLADSSKIKTGKNYILVYLMGYMFNPRPGFYNIVESVRKSLKLPVYHINPTTSDSYRRNVIAMKGMGPADFVRLFRNASFVVTDSFHGAAFSTIFNVPMIGVVKDDNNGDGRIATLRAKVGGSHSVLCHNKPFEIMPEEMDLFKCDSLKVEKLREFSLDQLKKMINNCQCNENNKAD